MVLHQKSFKGEGFQGPTHFISAFSFQLGFRRSRTLRSLASSYCIQFFHVLSVPPANSPLLWTSGCSFAGDSSEGSEDISNIPNVVKPTSTFFLRSSQEEKRQMRQAYWPRCVNQVFLCCPPSPETGFRSTSNVSTFRTRPLPDSSGTCQQCVKRSGVDGHSIGHGQVEPFGFGGVELQHVAV